MSLYWPWLLKVVFLSTVFFHATLWIPISLALHLGSMLLLSGPGRLWSEGSRDMVSQTKRIEKTGQNLIQEVNECVLRRWSVITVWWGVYFSHFFHWKCNKKRPETMRNKQTSRQRLKTRSNPIGSSSRWRLSANASVRLDRIESTRSIEAPQMERRDLWSQKNLDVWKTSKIYRTPETCWMKNIQLHPSKDLRAALHAASSARHPRASQPSFLHPASGVAVGQNLSQKTPKPSGVHLRSHLALLLSTFTSTFWSVLRASSRTGCTAFMPPQWDVTVSRHWASAWGSHWALKPSPARPGKLLFYGETQGVPKVSNKGQPFFKWSLKLRDNRIM